MSKTVQLADAAADFVAEVERASAANLAACLQCAKCTSGCPVAARGDLKPHVVVRLVQLGQRDAVLGCRTIWECTSCQTCATRCPQGVSVAAMNDALRQMSRAAGKVVAETRVPLFNDIFLRTIRRLGRMYEVGLMTSFKLRTRDFFSDADKVPMMLKKGKLSILPPRVAGKGERKQLFERARRAGGAK